jgi:hypothetical protein
LDKYDLSNTEFIVIVDEAGYIKKIDAGTNNKQSSSKE